jgi:hypothetical protein
MSKKKKNTPVQSYILAIKSMSLASGMMVFGVACDSIKKEWPECEKVEDAYTKFDDSIEKACNNQLGLTPDVVNYGKAFLDELNNFQNFPESQKDNLRELINRITKTVKEIINPV